MTNGDGLAEVLRGVLAFADAPPLHAETWRAGRYCPTPTIVEAAMALYGGHSVEAISRSDAGATNLSVTSASLDRIIAEAKANRRKTICFVTGVPGAGKTLVGLDIATQSLSRQPCEARARAGAPPRRGERAQPRLKPRQDRSQAGASSRRAKPAGLSG